LDDISDEDLWFIRDDLVVPNGLVKAAGGDAAAVVAAVATAAQEALAAAPTSIEYAAPTSACKQRRGLQTLLFAEPTSCFV
jgi:hypothetical protein